MGETPDDKFTGDTERPSHRVVFSYDFALGRFPITCAEYSKFDGRRRNEEEAKLPIVNVSWEDASAFCSWLARQTSTAFRLPTEAEWEYACRAGSATTFSSGHELTPSDANYLYSETGERIGRGERTPGGTYPANVFGICDLHGNVCEWVQDSWHDSYFGAPRDGSPWVDSSSNRRVIRGGAWDYMPRLLRSAWRDALPQGGQRDNLGFRLALTLPAAP